MADLILDARIASLEVSLMKVQNLLGWATRRQHCLEKMNKLLQDSSKDLRRSYRSIDHYVHSQMMDVKERGNVPDDLAAAANAIEVLNRLTGRLEAGQQELVPLSKFITHITGRGAALEAQSRFKKSAINLLDSLRSLNREDPRVWAQYEEDVRPHSQNLFTAFSEFLAGLALRDSGFDEDICETADELLRCFAISEANRPDLLTIPIPREDRAIPMAEILTAVVQLSYPEWTLWSLPIVAHEFWRAFACKQPEVRAWFKEVDLDVDDPQLCLADAFAASSMGPAYAFYAFLLALDPVNAFTSSAREPASAKRALAILVMLGATCTHHKVKPWTGVIDNLRNCWEQTVGVTTREVSELIPEERERITRAVSILAKGLDDTQVPFTAAHWERATKWANDLAQRNANNIQVDPSDRMRDVLNAAWLARRGVSDVTRIMEIADDADALRKRIPAVRGQVQSDFPDAA